MKTTSPMDFVIGWKLCNTRWYHPWFFLTFSPIIQMRNIGCLSKLNLFPTEIGSLVETMFVKMFLLWPASCSNERDNIEHNTLVPVPIIWDCYKQHMSLLKYNPDKKPFLLKIISSKIDKICVIKQIQLFDFIDWFFNYWLSNHKDPN